MSVFEKRLHETETSRNVVDSVKRSGVHFSIKIEAGRSDEAHVVSQFKKKSKARISQISRLFDFETGLRETELLRNLKKECQSVRPLVVNQKLKLK